MSILTHVPQLLWELGCDPAEVLAALGVEPSLLADREREIEYLIGARLIAHCTARTGCSHFGLLLGQKSELADLGIVGLLVQHSPDVGTALRNLIEHLHLHDRGGVPTLERSGAIAMLGFAVYEPATPAADQIHAAAIAHAQQIMHRLCGADWHANEVLLPFRRPADIEPFRRLFRAPLLFDTDRCALVFPAALLCEPVASADATLRRSLEALIAMLEGSDRGSFTSTTRRALRALLVTGKSSEAEVARAFAVHRRTLNRRLRDEGNTFRQVLDESRLEVARQMLRDSDAPVERIAGSLGYSGASAFGRAFRRWTGLSPLAWRAAAERELRATP